jgi:hypothetical protein
MPGAGAAAWPTMAILLLASLASAHAGHACVDPADATARRWLQDGPCTLPMYEAPRAGSRTFGEPAPKSAVPPSPPATMAGHAMFWRFPVQGLGPHEAPRHSWR